jgi:murein DD-endopeptidase MepM/ murein hydrolase activator NlpD
MKRIVFGIILAVCLSSCAVTPNLGPFYVYNQLGVPVPYGDGRHPGLDFRIDTGTPIIAASSGNVRLVDETGTDGARVEINHEYNFTSEYAHLSKVYVKKGQFVQKGQLIALSGASNNYGIIDNQHLHFGLCKDGQEKEGCDAYDPKIFWLGGAPQCFDPKMDYSAYSQKDITIPVACGDYGKELIAKSKANE